MRCLKIYVENSSEMTNRIQCNRIFPYEPRCEKTGFRGFRPGPTHRAVQLQKIVRDLKFRIQIEEELQYLYSENKGADQLRSYCAADLRLCFRICKKPVFSKRGSYQFQNSPLRLKVC